MAVQLHGEVRLARLDAVRHSLVSFRNVADPILASAPAPGLVLEIFLISWQGSQEPLD
jgi:hypothetical protein